MKRTIQLLVFIFLSQSLLSQGYSIDSFFVDIELTEQGEMNITETIEVTFTEEKRGIFRSIPYRYKLNGKKYTTPITKVAVPGYKMKVENEGSNKRIRIGDPDVYLTGPHTYEIQYSVDNAVIGYEDGQEIYWNLTGPYWDVKLNNIGFRLVLPESVEIQSEYIKVFTGYEGSKDQDAVVEKKGRVIEGYITRDLNFTEDATLAVKLPLGYLNDLPQFDQLRTTGINKEKNRTWYIAIPLMLIAIVRQWWSNMRQSAKPKGPIEQKFYPPKGLTSAHVGAYIDHKVQKRDVISLIPYWATEGFIKVRGLEDGDMQLVRLKDLPLDFPAYEQDFFNAIFADGDVISFSAAQYKFGPQYYKAKRALTKEIEAAGYYDASYVRLFKTWRWPLICVLIVVLGINALIFSEYVIFGIGLLVIGIFCFFLSFFTAPLSEFGREVHNHLLGLKDFLANGSEDDIRRLSDEDENYFSHMLPYAVAFGLDEKWLKSYENIYDTAPFWYETYYMGSVIRPTFGDFSKGFEVKEITRAFTTHPQVDTSSGGGSSFSSGGGFSGGGFGGGGGGSW